MRATAKLKHLSFEVTDIARTEWFHDRFLGRLGFRRFVRDAGYLGYTDGTVTIWFVHSAIARVRRKPPTGEEEVIADHLAFEVGTPAEVETLQAEFEKQELYPFFRGEVHPEFRPGYFSAIWTDPDQIVLEIYAVGRSSPKRTDRKAPTHRRKAKRPK